MFLKTESKSEFSFFFWNLPISLCTVVTESTNFHLPTVLYPISDGIVPFPEAAAVYHYLENVSIWRWSCAKNWFSGVNYALLMFASMKNKRHLGLNLKGEKFQQIRNNFHRCLQISEFLLKLFNFSFFFLH